MLDELFTKHHSDKGDTAPDGSPPGHFHCYGAAYEKYFLPMKNRSMTMFEIGVSIRGTDAPSLCAWEEFFPNAAIVGLDIYDYTLFQTGRIRIEVGNQANTEDLEKICMTHGPFDIIIDDGSHYAGHQLISFMKLFNSLKPDGVYVVEDLHILGAPHWSSDQYEAAQFTDAVASLVEKGIVTAEYFEDNQKCFQIVFIKKVKENPALVFAYLDVEGNLNVSIKCKKDLNEQAI